MDWSKALPYIASLATGGVPALITTAASAISDVLGAKVEPTLDAIDSAVRGATPEQMAALRKIDADLKTRLRELDVEQRRAELADDQSQQHEQQETLRNGDNAQDEYVRHTRPMIVRQSWYAGLLYLFACEIWHRLDPSVPGVDVYVLLTIWSPVLAYFGFRSIFDKGGMLGMFGRRPKVA